ncbi:MAG: CopG family transcriptional regulator [Actinomycetota bacterium]
MAKREGSERHVTLKIPRPLYEQLQQVIEDSGFHSVTEFATYVLRDLVSHHRSGEPLPEPGRAGATAAVEAAESDVESLNPDEIEAIRQRLQSLGYL